MEKNEKYEVIDSKDYKEFQEYKKKKESNEGKKGAAITAFVMAMVCVAVLFLIETGINELIILVCSIIGLVFANKAKGVESQPHKGFRIAAIPICIMGLILSGSVILIGLLIIPLAILCGLVSAGIGLVTAFIFLLPQILVGISTLIESISAASSSLLILLLLI